MRKLILIIIIFSGCSKKEDQSSTSIKVVEIITNLPISGADVSLYKYPAVLYQSSTDDNGICFVPSLYYDDAESVLLVAKPKYWPFYYPKGTTAYLTPEGWLQLRIHQVGNYTAGSYLSLSQSNQNRTMSHITDCSTAADSLIVLKSYGNQLNKIDWQVVNAGVPIATGTLHALAVPKFDTLKNVTLDY